jgi:hypothetical protein
VRFLKASLLFLFCSSLYTAPYRFAVLWTGLGEYELAKRLEKASQNLNWECILCHGGDKLDYFDNLVIDPNNLETIETMMERFHPDFIIQLKDNIKTVPFIPNYVALTGCAIEYFDGSFIECPNLLNFDGVLYSSPKINELKNYFERNGKPFYGIPWYVSCPKTDYKATTCESLFYCGFQWDTKRTNWCYQTMYTLLSGKGYFEVYGPESSWSAFPRSFKGLIPFGGDYLSEVIRKAGVTLVLHAQPHIDLGAPSSRIFEAAAACSVVISDQNPFILKEFADSVLYFNDCLSGEEMSAQIDAHMRWLFANPEEAEKLARRSHAIFVEKFSLESQLKNLGDLHEQILEEKQRKMIGDLSENPNPLIK